MNDIPRNAEAALVADLKKKFVFLSGPRQVGKTTLAKKIIAEFHGQYLVYDEDEDRRLILQKGYLGKGWVCLDEFHKFPRWKNHIKGVFDKYHESLRLLLTGSARLDVFQKSGDSLFGRYYLHHLHPFTFGEIRSSMMPDPPSDLVRLHAAAPGLRELMRFGGFPEPFFRQSEREHRRWSALRNQLLIREELRDLTHIELVGLVEQLMLLLPERIGSLFSCHSLAEDIRVSVPTIQNWMSIFERLFIVFKVTPYFQRVARSIRKQPKYFLYDWSQLPDEGARFENLTASHLFKAMQTWNDQGAAALGLHYVRDRNGREVDFLVVKDGRPWFLMEAKLSETRPTESLRYFSRRFNIPGIQLVLRENVHKTDGLVTVVSADRWLAHLP